MNRKNVGPNKAEKRIIYIILISLGLHLAAMIAMDFINFILFAKSEFEKNQVILYSVCALMQVGILFLIYWKQIKADWKVMLVIIGVVLAFYLIYPIGII